MAFFRLQNKVPNVYVDYSRDFQLLCRAYDVMNNQVLYNIDSIRRITDTQKCPSRLLSLLADKLGFFTKKNFTDFELRLILDAFPTVVKNKGSMKGIEQCVYTYLKTQRLSTDICIIHSETLTDHHKEYYIDIGIEGAIRNTDVLTEMLRYVIPTGYLVSFFFYTQVDSELQITSDSKNKAVLTFVTNNINSIVGVNDSTEFSANPSGHQIKDIRILNSVNMTDIENLNDDLTNVEIEETNNVATNVTLTSDPDGIIQKPTVDKIKHYVLFDKTYDEE